MANGKRYLRNLLEAGAAGALFALLFLAGVRNFRNPVRMEINVENTQQQELLLWANGKPITPQREPSFSLGTIRFRLPREEIGDLRLSPGPARKTIAIRRISLAAPLRKIDFSSVQIKKIFAPLSGVRKAEVKENAVEFDFTAEKPLLVFSRGILPSLERLSRDRTWIVIRSLAVSLVFLIFLHSFTLARWRLWRTPRILTDMVLIFFMALILPSVASVLRLPDPRTLNEKRDPAPRPEFDPGNPARFPRAFDAFFSDHFRFRSLLIRMHNLTRVRGFGVSPIPQVVIGKKGWLYFAREHPVRNVIDYYLAAVPFTAGEMEKWRMVLEARRNWLASRGIHYLVVIPPNKSTIYPEYLPAGISRVHPRSRLDQLLDYLRSHSTPALPVLDLRPDMFRAKSSRRLYHKTDTHWNDAGAFVAYQQILRELCRTYPALHPRSLADFSIRSRTTLGGDLAIMLGFPDILTEEQIILSPRTGPRAVISEPSRKISPWVMRSATECPAASPLRVVMFRDSFGNRLMNYLAEDFARIVFIWDIRLYFDTDLIEREKPDIVIEEMVERLLLGFTPEPPGGNLRTD